MKKRILALLLVGVLAFSLTGCEKEMALSLSFGDRTGTYSGAVNEAGIPDGYGKFTATNADGEKWTYEGEFKNGHFEGKGQTTWENGQREIGTYKNDVIVPLKDDELKSLYTTPDNYKYNCVEITGKVFAQPEYTDDGVALQMFQDYENSENNTIVYILDKDFKVKEGDYVKVIGIVGDTFLGENAFGGQVTAPTIAAREYSIVSYQDAVAPTTKSLDVNQTQTQFGYSITVQKVEYAETETRVYVKVDNQGSERFSLYSFNTKLTQNGKQYEEQMNWDAEYPEIQTDLLVGNSTEGIIAFPPIEEGSFTIIFEGQSDNWEEDLQPYTFDIEG